MALQMENFNMENKAKHESLGKRHKSSIDELANQKHRFMLQLQKVKRLFNACMFYKLLFILALSFDCNIRQRWTMEMWIRLLKRYKFIFVFSSIHLNLITFVQSLKIIKLPTQVKRFCAKLFSNNYDWKSISFRQLQVALSSLSWRGFFCYCRNIIET